MSRRALFLLPALIAGATMLAACDKPLPEVTVSGDGNVINLEASTYCFDADHCRDGDVDDYGKAPVLKIDRGSDVLISVPKVVAKEQWLVSGFALDSSGNQSPVEGIGTPVLHDAHTTRLQVSDSVTDDYFLGVVELDDKGKTTGSWIVKVSPQS